MRTPRCSGLRAGIPLVVVALLAGCGSSGSKSKTTASNTTAAVHGGTGQPVDGIPCNRTEQLEYHVHAHLYLLDNGKPENLPALIGIIGLGQCFYFLHTHDTSGVIHIEAPKRRTFTLGQFFDIWGQPLSATQATNLKGPFHVFVDQKPYHGNPRNITLGPHKLITIEAGKPVPPPAYTFPPGL